MVEVRSVTDRAVYSKVVVCAGRETARLARSVGLSLPVRLAAHVRLTFGVGDDGTFIDPAAIRSPDERAREYVTPALPGLHPELHDFLHCWVTDLPWSEDGVAVWEAGPVLFVAGHNLFKQAPSLGRALARAATGEGLAAGLEQGGPRLGEPQQ